MHRGQNPLINAQETFIEFDKKLPCEMTLSKDFKKGKYEQHFASKNPEGGTREIQGVKIGQQIVNSKILS